MAAPVQDGQAPDYTRPPFPALQIAFSHKLLQNACKAGWFLNQRRCARRTRTIVAAREARLDDRIKAIAGSFLEVAADRLVAPRLPCLRFAGKVR